MLESTFVVLPGIGESTERRLWETGIRHWNDFLSHPSLPGMSSERKRLYDEQLSHVQNQYHQHNFRFFSSCLKPRDHWRLFQDLRTRTVFLDIETTGEPAGLGAITVVGLYANGHMTTLVRHDTLTGERLNEELSKYDLLVTFFGTGFDLPYIRTAFPHVTLDHAHFDLCFAARRLGLRGGLKHIERAIGLSRTQGIQGLDGWDAVRLWHLWEQGDEEAGRVLCEYNEADVRNLEPLADHLYTTLRERHGPRDTYSPLQIREKCS